MSDQQHIHRNLPFLIIGNHPHAGATAYPVGASPESMTKKTLFGEEMYLLQRRDDDAFHGSDHQFYAEKKCMKPMWGRRK